MKEKTGKKDVELTFGSQLRKARQKRNLAQEALAEMVGCKQKDIYAFEKGDREPGFKFINKLAVALNISEEYFFKDVEPEAYLDTVDFTDLQFVYQDLLAHQKPTLLEIIDGLARLNGDARVQKRINKKRPHKAFTEETD